MAPRNATPGNLMYSTNVLWRDSIVATHDPVILPQSPCLRLDPDRPACVSRHRSPAAGATTRDAASEAHPRLA